MEVVLALLLAIAALFGFNRNQAARHRKSENDRMRQEIDALKKVKTNEDKSLGDPSDDLEWLRRTSDRK